MSNYQIKNMASQKYLFCIAIQPWSKPVAKTENNETYYVANDSELLHISE